MTGIEWYNAPRPALMRMEKLGGHTAGGTVGGFIAALAVGAVAFLSNSYTHGGLVRVLGGVTAEDLAREVALHPGPQGVPGPQGPPGPAGPSAPPGDGSSPSAAVPVVRLVPQASLNFDKSGPVSRSEAYPMCTLSNVVLHRDAKHPEGSCQVKRGTQSNSQWEVVVSGATCSVTCFTLSIGK